MTNGSSQGLFVIVAVVIFGIFIAISYVIYQENMSVSLANIFSDATNQSNDSLEGNLVPILKKTFHEEIKDVRTISKAGYNAYILDNMREVNFPENNYFGIGFGNTKDFDSFSEYEFSFNMNISEGKLGSIGGHLSAFSEINFIKINDEKVAENVENEVWNFGVKYNFENNKDYKVILNIKTNDLTEDTDTEGLAWFQPNRRNPSPTNFRIEAKDFKIVKKGG